jgi:hypothetical protein
MMSIVENEVFDITRVVIFGDLGHMRQEGAERGRGGG